MTTCKDCKFYRPEGTYGFCVRWTYGYHQPRPVGNEIIVENDEGWGAIMGPDFGCVLGEAK